MASFLLERRPDTFLERVTMSFHFIVYQSQALIPDDPHEHNRILESCNAKNKMRGVTGFLHREDKWFLQYLEGSKDALETTMAAIRKDPRHKDVRQILAGEVPARRFPDWQMGFVNGAQMSLADLLDTHGDGLAFQGDDPFDIVVFLSANSELLRERHAA